MKRTGLLLLILLGLLLHGPAVGATLVDGPTATRGEDGQIAIRWTTDVSCGSRVQYGPSADKLIERADGSLGTNHLVMVPKPAADRGFFYTVGTARVPLATNSFGLTSARLPAASAPPGKPAASPRPAPPARETWGNPASLQDHFNRHGRDFNAKNPDDYARQAWEFLQRAQAEGWPMKLDEEGVRRVLDPKTRAFAAYNRNGTTKTFFKPESRDYFERQPGELVKPPRRK